MPHLGVPELVLILVIVIAVFGAGKLANIGGALGKSIHDFRESAKGEEAEEAANQPAAPQAVVTAPPAAPQVAANPKPDPSSEAGEQLLQ